MSVSRPRLIGAISASGWPRLLRAVTVLVLLFATTSSPIAAQEFSTLFSTPRESVLPWTPLRTWLATHDERNENVDTPIQTDRPSFTAAHTLVPKGWVQVESGYQFTYNRNGGLLTNSNQAPQLNLRVGLADWVEWRTLWAGVETVGEHTLNGGLHRFETSSANMQTGFKFRATKENGLIPQSALITTLFLPTGSASSGTGHVSPLVAYIYCWSLAEPWTLTGSTGTVLARHGNEGVDESFQSVVLGQEWSDQLSSYAEWYVVNNQDASGSSTPHTMDAGVLWRPLSNIQFDWRAGFGLNNSADDFFTGVGFSARY
jgi:hypothetical protein